MSTLEAILTDSPEVTAAREWYRKNIAPSVRQPLPDGPRCTEDKPVVCTGLDSRGMAVYENVLGSGINKPEALEMPFITHPCP